MNRFGYSVLLILAMAGAFLAGSIVNQRGGVKAAALAAPVPAPRYLCPMHPAVVSDHPGDCPACGMALVVEAAAATEAARPGIDSPVPRAIRVAEERRQLIGVRVGQVERSATVHSLRMVGRVVADETRVSTVNAGIDGFVRGVSAATTGSVVKKNQVLATISSPDAIPAIQSFVVALSAMDRLKQGGAPDSAQAISTSSNYQQKVEKLLDLGMSMEQVEEVRRTHEMPKEIRVVAPGDGVLLARTISSGQRFQRGADFFRVADLARVWILADVIGADADAVRPGMRARVSAPDRGQSYEARVADIPPQFDPVTRTLKVRLEVDNPRQLLRPEMFVDVELSVSLPPSISVPAEAVLDNGLHRAVFVERGEGVFEAREVQTGWRFDDRVEVVQGLHPGERIAMSGTFLLDSESRMMLARASATSSLARR